MSIGKKKEPDTGAETARPYGKRKVTVTVTKHVTLNLRRMGLEELFGKQLHDWKDGELTVWAANDDVQLLKKYRSNKMIDIKFE
jgi:hypothetical protein